MHSHSVRQLLIEDQATDGTADVSPSTEIRVVETIGRRKPSMIENQCRFETLQDFIFSPEWSDEWILVKEVNFEIQ